MKRYYKYIKPYLPAFILSPLLMLCEVWGEIQLPALMADIINVGAVNRDVAYIMERGGRMLFMALFMILTGTGSAWFGARASIGFSGDLRRDVFKKVQEFSFKDIDEFSTGSLITRLTNDITQLQNLVMMSLRMLMRCPGMLIGGAVMAYRINPKMASVILIVIPILSILIGLVIRTALPRFSRMQGRIDDINNLIREALTNVRIIKSFVREDYERERFAGANEDLKEASLNAFKVVIFNIPIVTLAMNVTTLGAVWVGGLQAMAGTMPVGDLSAMITYITQVLVSLIMLAMILIQSSRALASSARISEVLKRKPDLTDEDSSQRDAAIGSGKVEFKNVSFSYYKGEKEKVLKNINIEIPSGAGVGIIGSTGSGKSSLVQLIPRLYDVDEGSVLVDGKDVRDLSLKELRNSVSMVLQKNVLFSGTIAQNLRWGDENASDESLRQAADYAQALGFVEALAQGFDTELTRGGSNVSGGQKQRLCIARALLKRPKILILDDSTSAVDTATEAMIRKAFSSVYKDITKIIIAQRITSVMELDQIIVLEKGQIVGHGNHSELMKSCDTYREIYDSQMEEDKEVSA